MLIYSNISFCQVELNVKSVFFIKMVGQHLIKQNIIRELKLIKLKK